MCNFIVGQVYTDPSGFKPLFIITRVGHGRVVGITLYKNNTHQKGEEVNFNNNSTTAREVLPSLVFRVHKISRFYD